MCVCEALATGFLGEYGHASRHAHRHVCFCSRGSHCGFPPTSRGVHASSGSMRNGPDDLRTTSTADLRGTSATALLRFMPPYEMLPRKTGGPPPWPCSGLQLLCSHTRSLQNYTLSSLSPASMCPGVCAPCLRSPGLWFSSLTVQYPHP